MNLKKITREQLWLENVSDTGKCSLSVQWCKLQFAFVNLQIAHASSFCVCLMSTIVIAVVSEVYP